MIGARHRHEPTVAVIGAGYVLDITPHAARVGVATGVLRFDNDGDYYVNRAFGYNDVLDLPRESDGKTIFIPTPNELEDEHINELLRGQHELDL